MDNNLGIDLIKYKMVKTMIVGEQSPIPVSLERHRNEEKDYLAKKKQECQSRVTKRKIKSRKRKVSISGDDSDSLSIDSPSLAEGKESQMAVTPSTDIVVFFDCQKFKYR